MANRYSQYAPGTNYSPESFRDMAVVPIALRQRHDAVLQAQDDMLLQLNNIQVPDEEKFQDYYNQKRDEITTKVNDLTNKINTIGAGDTNLIGEFRNMKRDYNKEVSNTGGLGSLSNLKETVDKTKANYMEFAIKQNWSPEKASLNYDRDYKEYMDNIRPEDIGKRSFSQFNPTFAPKFIEASAMAEKFKGIVGEFSEEIGFSNIIPSIDQYGMITSITTGNTRLDQSNSVQLERLKDALNSTVLNPDSPEMQYLRYSKGIRPNDRSQDARIAQEFMSEAGKYIGVMETTKSRDITTNETRIISTGDGSGGRTPKPPSTTTLVSEDRGQEVFNSNQDFTQVVNGDRIKELESIERQRPLTEEEVMEYKSQTQLQNRLAPLVATPEYQGKINDYLSKNKQGNAVDLNSYKSTIKTYQDQIDNIKNTAQYNDLQKKGGLAYLTPDDYRVGTPDVKMLKQIEALEVQRNRYKDVLNNAYKSAIGEGEDLKYSKYYTISAGEEGKKQVDIFNANAADYGSNWLKYGKNAGMQFTTYDSDDTLNNKDHNEKLDTLIKDLETNPTSYKIDGILDGGGTGNTQLVFTYNSKKAGKDVGGKLYINYDNNATDSSKIDNWLTSLRSVMDPTGVSIINSIIDNKQLKKVSVSSEDFWKNGISDNQTKSVKDMDKVLNSNIKNNQVFKSKDYLGNAAQTNMVLNKQGFYELYTANDTKGTNIRPVNTKDWYDRQLAKDYATGASNVSSFGNASDITVKARQAYDMLGLATLSQQEQIQLGGPNTRNEVQKLNTEFIQAMDSLEGKPAEQYEMAKTYYNAISKYKIAHKNMKRFY